MNNEDTITQFAGLVWSYKENVAGYDRLNRSFYIFSPWEEILTLSFTVNMNLNICNKIKWININSEKKSNFKQNGVQNK